MATRESQRTYRDLGDAGVKAWIADQGLKGTGHDYWARLARDLTADATKHAEANELSTEKWGEFEDLLSEALQVVDNAMLAVNGGYIADNDEVNDWKHQRHALELALKSDAPIIYKDNIQNAAALYLKLPFRSQRMDYVLVELLIACELFAFARQMSWALKQSSLWGWAKARFYSALFYFAVVLAVQWLFNADWGTVAFWIYLAESALSAIPLFRPSKLAKVFQEMNGVYCELTPSGPFSARHIEHRAETAAEKGVVWPAPLFAVLDDINSRGGKF